MDVGTAVYEIIDGNLLVLCDIYKQHDFYLFIYQARYVARTLHLASNCKGDRIYPRRLYNTTPIVITVIDIVIAYDTCQLLHFSRV